MYTIGAEIETANHYLLQLQNFAIFDSTFLINIYHIKGSLRRFLLFGSGK